MQYDGLYPCNISTTSQHMDYIHAIFLLHLSTRTISMQYFYYISAHGLYPCNISTTSQHMDYIHAIFLLHLSTWTISMQYFYYISAHGLYPCNISTKSQHTCVWLQLCQVVQRNLFFSRSSYFLNITIHLPSLLLISCVRQ